MASLFVLIALAGLASGTALVEAWWHRRRLNRIPIRIHVNGTRGKSSVTRLIAAGLRAGGIRTCAKTTGTLARMILPDGKELPIFRVGRANVIEQKRVVRAANQCDAQALVIECMALQPLLQSICELQLVRATHGVITNARADHLDVMGPTRLDVAAALSGTMPVRGKFFTAENRADSLAILNRAAVDRGTGFHAVDASQVAAVTAEDLAGFSYLEHPDNVALALSVCQSLGIDRDVALEGMWSAEPDPGAMRVHTTRVLQPTVIAGDREAVAAGPAVPPSQPSWLPEKAWDSDSDLSQHGSVETTWYFVNGFAANDPESTEQIWNSAFDRFPSVTRRVMVMNCRADRLDRSLTMGVAAVRWKQPDQVIVIGSGTEIFTDALIAGGFAAEKIVTLGMVDGPEVAEAVAAGSAREQSLSTSYPRLFDESVTEPSHALMVMGIGNVAGPGWKLDDFFRSHSRWSSKAVIRNFPVLPSSLQSTVASRTDALIGVS